MSWSDSLVTAFAVFDMARCVRGKGGGDRRLFGKMFVFRADRMLLLVSCAVPVDTLTSGLVLGRNFVRK